MATTIIFSPPSNGAQSFPAVLDGSAYQMTIIWNLFGQRWYLQCVDDSQTLIFLLPLIGSPDNQDINLLSGYFLVSTLVFQNSTQTIIIGP